MGPRRCQKHGTTSGPTKGNLTSITRPACTGCPGATTTITVDALSRVATVTDGKGQKTTYAYDGVGNLTSRASGTNTTTFTYDKLNRVTNKAIAGSMANACSGQTGMTSSYDAVGNLLTACDAGGTVAYRYNANNELISIQEPGGNCTATPVTGACTLISYTNDAGVYQDGRRMKVTFPPSTGTVMKMTYDGAGKLASIVGTRGTTTLSSFSYTYGVINGADTEVRRSVTTPSGTTSYGYDGHNRLCYEFAGSSTAACESAPSGASRWAYDRNGNRTSQVLSAGRPASLT